MLSKMISPHKILEIGTFTGYSAICLAEGLTPDGHLHTIEKDDEIAETALHFFEKSGLADKITLHTGDALQIIPQINCIFDLVFIDAAKRQYLDYYHAVFDKVSAGGYIIVDNILWYGKVANPEAQDETTLKLRLFNDFIQRDNRVEKAIIRNRDGLYILRKIKQTKLD
jgi:predicted O-methyltransferase YrrM